MSYLKFGQAASDSIVVRRKFYLDPEQLRAVLEELGANHARLQGNNMQADHCFLHSNSSPTLGVSLDAPHPWSCFNPLCKKGKYITDLVQCALGCDIGAANAWIMQRFPDAAAVGEDLSFVSEEEDKKVIVAVVPETALAAYPLDPKKDPKIGYRAIAYLVNEHGDCLCTPAQADEYELGYNLHDHHLTFPVRHLDGTLAGIIGRAMKKGVKNRYINYDEGIFKKSKCLMGAHLPLEDGPVVVVEGPTDYIYLRAHGVPNVRALMGSSPSDEQVSILLSHGRPIVPLLDRDSAGKSGTEKLDRLVKGRARFKTAHWPKGSGDDPRKIPARLIPELISSFGVITFIS